MNIDLTPQGRQEAPLDKALYYWTRQQPTLRAFLNDGRFPISNAHIEPISNAHVERLLRVVSTFQ